MGKHEFGRMRADNKRRLYWMVMHVRVCKGMHHYNFVVSRPDSYRGRESGKQSHFSWFSINCILANLIGDVNF